MRSFVSGDFQHWSTQHPYWHAYN